MGGGCDATQPLTNEKYNQRYQGILFYYFCKPVITTWRPFYFARSLKEEREASDASAEAWGFHLFTEAMQ